MDLAQLEQIVNWMDEEQRRNRSEIMRLGHLMDAHNSELTDQTKHVQELQSSFTRIESHLGRMQQFETALDNARQEFITLYEREEEQRQRLQRELERARVAERDAFRRELASLEREIGRIGQIEQAVLLRDDDITRLNEVLQGFRAHINQLSTELEEKTQHVPFLLENKGVDQKRLQQLQEDQVENFKRQEDLKKDIAQQEIEQRKFRQELAELYSTRDKTARDLDVLREEVKSQIYDVAHQVNTVPAVLKEMQVQLDKVQTQIDAFNPFQATAQKSLTEVRQVRERLDQGLQQARESERLFQAKMERMLTEMQTEAEEQGRKLRLQQDRHWQEQKQVNDNFAEQIPPLQQHLRVHEELLKQLWSLQEIYPQLALKAAQDQVEQIHTSIRQRDQALRSLEEEWMKMRRSLELYAESGNGTQPQPTP